MQVVSLTKIKPNFAHVRFSTSGCCVNCIEVQFYQLFCDVQFLQFQGCALGCMHCSLSNGDALWFESLSAKRVGTLVVFLSGRRAKCDRVCSVDYLCMYFCRLEVITCLGIY